MWSLTKNTGVPFSEYIKEVRDIPYTISYVIRKRLQIDGLNELPRDKRPPDYILWSNNSKLLDKWIDKVLYNKKQEDDRVLIPLSEIE